MTTSLRHLGVIAALAVELAALETKDTLWQDARWQRYIGVIFITDSGAGWGTTGTGKKEHCLTRLIGDSDTLESYLLLTAALAVELPAPERRNTVWQDCPVTAIPWSPIYYWQRRWLWNDRHRKERTLFDKTACDSDTLESYLLLTAAVAVERPAPKRKDAVW